MNKVTDVKIIRCPWCGATALYLEWSCGCTECLGKHLDDNCRGRELPYFSAYEKECGGEKCPVKKHMEDVRRLGLEKTENLKPITVRRHP